MLLNVILTFVVSIGTHLHANGQIDNMQMGRCASETRILASTSARFARFMACPADTFLIWETAWRTSAHTCAVCVHKQRKPNTDKKRELINWKNENKKWRFSHNISAQLLRPPTSILNDWWGAFAMHRTCIVLYSLVQSIVFAGNTLRRSTSIASLLIAFRVTVALHNFCVCIGHDVAALRYGNVVTIERCHRLFRIAGRPVKHITWVHILICIVQWLRLHIRWYTERINICIRIVARRLLLLLWFVFEAKWARLGAVEY